MAIAGWASTTYPKDNCAFSDMHFFNCDRTTSPVLPYYGPFQGRAAIAATGGYESNKMRGMCAGQVSGRPPLQLVDFTLTVGSGNYPDEGFTVNILDTGYKALWPLNEMVLFVSPDGESVYIGRFARNAPTYGCYEYKLYVHVEVEDLDADGFVEPANDTLDLTGYTVQFTALALSEGVRT